MRFLNLVVAGATLVVASAVNGHAADLLQCSGGWNLNVAGWLATADTNGSVHADRVAKAKATIHTNPVQEWDLAPGASDVHVFPSRNKKVTVAVDFQAENPMHAKRHVIVTMWGLDMRPLTIGRTHLIALVGSNPYTQVRVEQNGGGPNYIGNSTGRAVFLCTVKLPSFPGGL